MTSIVYYGVPSADGDKRGNLVRFIDSDDPDAQPRELAHIGYNATKFAWGYIVVGGKPSKAMVPGAAPLALAICTHALASEMRGLALYQRFKMRVMDKWREGEAWAISAEEVAAIADKIEGDELSQQELHQISRDKVVPESEIGPGVSPGMGGIVWDTDEHGNWIKPRGSE